MSYLWNAAFLNGMRTENAENSSTFIFMLNIKNGLNLNAKHWLINEVGQNLTMEQVFQVVG